MCGQVILMVQAAGVDIHIGTATFAGLTYKCPNIMCGAVIGCQIDPIAIKTDTVEAVLRALGR